MTVKEEALNAISEMPDNAPIEDIMYKLYVLDKIHQAEKDVAENRIISHEALKSEIASW